MWRITIIANNMIMILFWLLSILSVSLANNWFVQYAEKSVALPTPTKVALSLQAWFAFLPLLWIVISGLLWKKIKKQNDDKRSEILLSFTVITIMIGLLLFCFYLMAGLLPFFYIGVAIN